MTAYDVVIVGCGMAGLSAGVRAAELGRDVAILEKSPKEHRGGQTRFSESFRVPSADCDLSEHGYEFAVPDYTPEEFYDDIVAQTNGKADEDIARTLVDNAGPTVEWLTEKGITWDMEPLAVGYTVARTWFDGEEAVGTLVDAAEDRGADVFYEAEARELQFDGTRVTGLEAVVGDDRLTFDCDAVIIASGGYESSSRKRAAYMGAGYDDMKVRGSRYNTGEAIDMATDAGARAIGQWSGAHIALIDANAPNFEGGANRVDGYQYGVLLNVDGKRFVDEGEDARAHTYAKFGRLIFEEPEHRAYIVVDSAVREEFVRATGPSDPQSADSFEDLFTELDIDTEQAVETIREFNAACDPDEFDPHSLDGNRVDLSPPKSNWAIPIDDPPYYAYEVTGGITFAFGGVDITPDAQVRDGRGQVIPGLYAAGNSTGGLFFDNYPGGTGLTNAAVYGKLAAEHADEYVDG